MSDEPVKITAPALVVAPDNAARVSEPVSPKTTVEEDRSTLGQRRINLIWELTQAIIAVMVTSSTLYVAGFLALRGDGETAAFLLLSNVFFVVISTYIQRTNHTKIGGVGPNQSGR